MNCFIIMNYIPRGNDDYDSELLEKFVPCSNCKTVISEQQARRTYDCFDRCLCPECEETEAISPEGLKC